MDPHHDCPEHKPHEERRRDKKSAVVSIIGHRLSLSLAYCNTVVRTLSGQMTQTLLTVLLHPRYSGDDYVSVTRIFQKCEWRLDRARIFLIGTK